MTKSEKQLKAFCKFKHKGGFKMYFKLQPQGDLGLISLYPMNICTVNIDDRDYLFGGIRESVYDKLVEKYHDVGGFKNDDLSLDISKIESFDAPITVSKEEDFNLDYPFVIDVEDNSYFYVNEKDRDSDFELLKSIVPQFSFVEF